MVRRPPPTPAAPARRPRGVLRLLRGLPWWLLGLLVLAGAPRTGAADAPPTPTAIDEAITRGVAWLLTEQKPTGAWSGGGRALGHTALATLALLHCGLSEEQTSREARQLARALRYLDGQGPGRSDRRATDTRTYEASLLLMLLRARGRPADRARMQRLADLLCWSQARNGQWWYDGKGAPDIDGGDNSNTQFALLALGLAHGEGLKVERATFSRALAWWVSAAGTQGGFGYASGGSPKSAPTGSMTAAGIACLAITRAILEPPTALEPAAQRAPSRAARTQELATAYLAQVFSVTRNDGPALDRKNQRQRMAGRGWLHYYLWTVERAMVLAGQERLGPLDWYADGARHLLASQARDGSWRQENPLYATCFALLFLARAADPPRAFTPRPTPVPEPGRPVTPPAVAPGDGPTPAVPADEPRLPPGDATAWLAEDLPVGELPRRCRLAGPASLRPLVRALGHPDKAVRARAWEALGALLPEETIQRADRHPLARGRLELWLRLNERFLQLVGERFAIR